MPFKDLEHEGNENFDGMKFDRSVVRKELAERDKLYEEMEHIVKAKAQEAWLSPHNPILWNEVD